MRFSRRSPSKLGVLTLAIAFLLVHFGGAWHLSREEHVRCAEHGDWIEHSARAPCTAREHGPHVDPAAPEPGEHDHCALVLASQSRGIVWQGDTFLLGLEPATSMAPVGHPAPLDPGFALYLLAPKQSPPC